MKTFGKVLCFVATVILTLFVSTETVFADPGASQYFEAEKNGASVTITNGVGGTDILSTDDATVKMKSGVTQSTHSLQLSEGIVKVTFDNINIKRGYPLYIFGSNDEIDIKLIGKNQFVSDGERSVSSITGKKKIKFTGSGKIKLTGNGSTPMIHDVSGYRVLDAKKVVASTEENASESACTEISPSDAFTNKYKTIYIYGKDYVDPTPSGDEEIGFNIYDFLKYFKEEKEEKPIIKEIVDKDTYKSSVPSKTVMALDANGKMDMDMKVHPSSEQSVYNQEFLVNYWSAQVGKTPTIILTSDIFMRNDLLNARYGQKDKLVWNNLNYKIPGSVYAVVYNETDGAYLISGTIDANGNATFEGFILRPASTITIFAAN